MQINTTWSSPAAANRCDNHQLLATPPSVAQNTSGAAEGPFSSPTSSFPATSPLCRWKRKWRGPLCLPPPFVTQNTNGGVPLPATPPPLLKRHPYPSCTVRVWVKNIYPRITRVVHYIKAEINVRNNKEMYLCGDGHCQALGSFVSFTVTYTASTLPCLKIFSTFWIFYM